MKLFKKKVDIQLDSHQITSLGTGEVIDIQKVSDPVFAAESMGPSVAFISDKNTLVSPIDGEICMLFPTQHAIGIKSETGIEILIHIGINTVELNGMGFKTFVSQGQHVKRGDRLIKIDFRYLKEQGYDGTVMLILTNTNQKKVIKHNGKCTPSDIIMTLSE